MHRIQSKEDVLLNSVSQKINRDAHIGLLVMMPLVYGIDACIVDMIVGQDMNQTASFDGFGHEKFGQHSDAGARFLGIDHTAIVVSSTQQSLAFYRGVLGLTVAGESENYGSEQERLNNVFGARLRITALKGAQGPGIEFLEYLAPGNGRSISTDTRASDLWHGRCNCLVMIPQKWAGGYGMVATSPCHPGR